MDLKDYLNQDLKECIRSVTVFEGKAKDSGNTYYALDIHFINGYDHRLFLNNEQRFAIINAFQKLDSED